MTKKFGDNIIFKNLNFDINEGEVITITGESGKGKTTLLRCLVGLEKTSDGTIEIFGKKLVENGKYAPIKTQKEILKNVGMVFQNYGLFPNLTVGENLKIICKDDKKIDKFLRKFELLDKNDDEPKNVLNEVLSKLDSSEINKYPVSLKYNSEYLMVVGTVRIPDFVRTGDNPGIKIQLPISISSNINLGACAIQTKNNTEFVNCNISSNYMTLIVTESYTNLGNGVVMFFIPQTIVKYA